MFTIETRIYKIKIMGIWEKTILNLKTFKNWHALVVFFFVIVSIFWDIFHTLETEVSHCEVQGSK